ncbi:HERC2 [Symbiodinium sp. KB8]|nr:HERC2 [Symbiodinium sp. KB8]
MSKNGVVETPPVEKLSQLVVEFYSLAGYPDPGNIEDWRAAQLVELYDKAFAIFMKASCLRVFVILCLGEQISQVDGIYFVNSDAATEAGGDAASARRRDDGDDGTDPYIVEGDTEPEESPSAGSGVVVSADSDSPPVAEMQPVAAPSREPSLDDAIVPAEAAKGPWWSRCFPRHEEPEPFSGSDLIPRSLNEVLAQFDDSEPEAASGSGQSQHQWLKDNEADRKYLQTLLAASAEKLEKLCRAKAIDPDRIPGRVLTLGNGENQDRMVLGGVMQMDHLETQPWDGVAASPPSKHLEVIDLDTPKKVLTRNDQLTMKAASCDEKPSKGKGRGRGRGGNSVKAVKQDKSKQGKPKRASASSSEKPIASASECAEEAWQDEEWEEGDWDAAEWTAAEWDEWEEWNASDWAAWDKWEQGEEHASTTKKRNRAAKKAEAEAAPAPKAAAAAKAKQVGRVRKGNVSTEVADDDLDDSFSYPQTFARRACPPIKGSEAFHLWRGITKSFNLQVLPFLERGTRANAEAVYWQYARVRWQQSGLRPGDEDFLELMDMVLLLMTFTGGWGSEAFVLCILLVDIMFEKELDFIEHFAGSAVLTHTARETGYEAAALDKIYGIPGLVWGALFQLGFHGKGDNTEKYTRAFARRMVGLFSDLIQQPREFRQWSGSSMLDGLSGLTAVKKELPDDPQKLANMIQDLQLNLLASDVPVPDDKQMMLLHLVQDPVGAVETKPNKANHDDTSDDDMDDDDEDTFLRKVETYKDTLRYRDEGTDGGFYSRDDMIKKVPDGGLGWSAKYADKVIAWCQANPNGNIRKNKYDDELEEYWCDKRTSGELPKLNDIKDSLGKLYDELAALQAEAKIGNMTDAQNEKLEKVFENVKKQHLCCNPPLKQMTLAISSEVKNRKLKKKEGNKRKAATAPDAEKGSAKVDMIMQAIVLDSSLKATAKHVVTIAEAFTAGESDCPALADMAKCPKNDAEKALQSVLRKFDLTLNVPTTMKTFADRATLPVLMPQDFISGPRLQEFWSRYRAWMPDHEMWTHSHFDTSALVPLMVHGDGGRTFKKDELMVVQFQPVLGFGTRISHPLPRQSHPGVNLAKHTFTTRFLYGVLHKSAYKEDPSCFTRFFDAFMQDLAALYHCGLNLQNKHLHFLVIGVKGDLPFLQKAAHLERTFLNVRKAPEKASSKPLSGCCHLCLAGTAGFPFEEFNRAPKFTETMGACNPYPWSHLPPFVEYIPHVRANPAALLRLDLMHIVHLGVGRDFTGSSCVVMLGLYEDATSVSEAIDRLSRANFP